MEEPVEIGRGFVDLLAVLTADLAQAVSPPRSDRCADLMAHVL
jgi:hypothetical protein